MIADDIKITITFHQAIPDGACIHKKGTVANYKKKELLGQEENDVPGKSHNHGTLLGVRQHRVGNIFVK